MIRESNFEEQPYGAQSDIANASYHGHPNYVATWTALVVLLAIGLAVASFNRLLAVVFIFGIAVLKTLLVAGNFMHLRWEPRALWAIAAVGLVCALFLFLGVYIDIVPVRMEVAR